jgi:hypothetical protein
MIDNVCTDLRGRAYQTETDRKYLSLRNTSYYRGADYPYNHSLKREFVITEGEIKTIASQLAGIDTIGLPGVMSFKPMINKDAYYTVCFDSQVDHCSDIIRAIYRLSTLLSNLKVATLPLKNELKQDIDSFILNYGVAAYRRVIDRALPFHEYKRLVRV